MNAYLSIFAKLHPLKTYSRDTDTNLSVEIASYAAALDEHRSLLDEFLKECFITTAETYGIEKREKLVGEVKVDYPIDRRRNMLILRNTLGENDFTKQGIGKFLSCFGVTNYQIIEMPELLEISFYIDGDYSNAEKAWIEKQINMMLPAHLVSTVTFQGISWNDIDSKNMCFAEIDSNNYTWNFINNLI